MTAPMKHFDFGARLNPLRIVMLTTGLEGGGAARVMTHMANHWAATGNDVTLLSFEDNSARPFYDLCQDVRVQYLGLYKASRSIAHSLANNWQRSASIRKAVLAQRPHVAISFIDTANIRTIAALIGSGVPIIISERVHPKYEDIGLAFRLLRRLFYPLADCMVVQTQQIAEYCKHWGLRRLRVIANPVSSIPTKGTAPTIPRPALVAAGRLCPQKAYDQLLLAFAQVAPSLPGWTLCIAGDGPLRGEIEQQAKELGLAGRIRILGQVQDMGGVLAQADVFVLSSLYEGFPNSLCEALAAGVACVSTDCPGGPAVLIRHEQNGLLSAPGDVYALASSLARVMGDGALRKQLGEAGREVVHRFSLERIMDEWEQCIIQCLRS